MADIIIQADDGTQAIVQTAPAVEIVVDGQMKGEPGPPGANGDPGPGLPTGGTLNQIPVKNSAEDFDFVYKSPTEILDTAGLVPKIGTPSVGYLAVINADGGIENSYINADTLGVQIVDLYENKLNSTMPQGFLLGRANAGSGIVENIALGNGLSFDGTVLNIAGSGNYFNVKDFGAMGDGIADDGPAIQDAINAAEAVFGGIVIIPRGVYVITEEIILKDGISIWGDAGNSHAGHGTIILQTTANKHGFYMETTTEAIGNLTIQDIRIEANMVTGTSHGIYLKNNSATSYHPPFVYMTFRNVFVTGFRGYGFNAESLIVSTMNRVICQENTNGFFFNGDGYGTNTWSSVNTSVHLEACYANGNTNKGFHLYRSTYMSFSACAADSNGDQYYLDKCNAINFSGSGAEHGPDEVMTGHMWTITGASGGIVLNGCNMLYYQNYGIYVTGNSYGVVITGFLDSGPGTNGTYALKTDAGVRVTSIGSSYTNSQIAAGTVSFLDDNGTMSIPGLAYFSGGIMVESSVDIVGGTLKMLPYEAIQHGTAKVLELGSYGTPINGVGIEMAEAGGAPVLYPQGTDTNIDLALTAKGTGGITMSGKRVKNVATPSAGTDAVNKDYADALAGGATNLSATLSATNTIINSDTGTDATIPAVDGTNAGVMTPTMKTKLDGVEALADVTDAGNVGSSIHGATAKTTPVDADTMPLIDSAASNVLKKVTWANIKATIKTYFDTLYANIVHTHAQSDVTNLTTDLAAKAPLASPTFTGTPLGVVNSPVSGRLASINSDGSLANSGLAATTVATQLTDLYDITDSSMGVVVHGATAGTSRPAAYGQIYWIGSVEPTNAVNNDIWINTA